MIFINIKSNLKIDDLMNKLYYANEKHSIFSFWDNFNDDCLGLHCYTKGNNIYGYYENGIRNLEHNLLSAKTWFYGRISTSNNSLRYKCIIVHAPFMLFLSIICIILGLINIHFTYDSVGLIGCIAFCSFFEYHIIKEQVLVKHEIKELFKDNTGVESS